MRAFFIIVFLSGFFALSAAPSAKSKVPSPIKEIYIDELSKLMQDKLKVVVIDVRSARFDDRKRLPGALSIPYNTPQKSIQDKVPSKDTPIVVYCGSHNCPSSHYMAERLIRMGYKTIYKYTEGVKGWISAGKATEAVKESQVPDEYGELL